jgi:hypothetical protein
MLEIEFLYDILLFELLIYGNDEYVTIFKEMLNDEFYILQDKWYDVLIKIVCKGELIGYIAGNYDKTNRLILELGYLLSSYRDKGIFIKVLLMVNEEVSLHMPNRFLINSLLVNGYAEQINEVIIKSKFLLSFNDENDEIVFSYYYHLQKCGVILGELISPLQRVDIECFNADKYR